MALKVYNSANIVAERKAKIGDITKMRVPLFEGSIVSNTSEQSGVARYISAKETTGNFMSELVELRHKIVSNAAQPPAAADIEAFFGKLYLEVTRRAIESPDLTSVIAMEQINYEFPENVTLRDLLPFRGVMGTISGTNDPVPLIEQNTGETDTVAMSSKAVGWKDSLKNMLYNKFFTMDKVVQAAVDAYTDYRNSQTAGVMVGATYVASQLQAAVTTSGLTLDEKTYETILAGVKKLRSLKDPQTGRAIAVPAINILCNSADTWQIENVIRGQLNGNGSDSKINNRPALPINAVVEYDHGINHGFTIGKEVASFPGVTAGTFFLYVPDVLMVATKRPLTMETGRGSVLELSTEERAWYAAQGTYAKTFLGSSYPGTSIGASYGFTVKVTLPT